MNKNKWVIGKFFVSMIIIIFKSLEKKISLVLLICKASLKESLGKIILPESKITLTQTSIFKLIINSKLQISFLKIGIFSFVADVNLEIFLLPKVSKYKRDYQSKN